MPWPISSRRFLMTGLVFLGGGIALSLLPGDYSTDIFLHDKYFVLPMPHLIWSAALLCGILAVLSGLVALVDGTTGRSRCHKLHFWSSVGGMCAVVGSLLLAAVRGQQGDPSMMHVFLLFALGGIFAFAVGQLILLFSAIHGLVKSLRRAVA